jgi:hypothetical protein
VYIVYSNYANNIISGDGIPLYEMENIAEDGSNVYKINRLTKFMKFDGWKKVDTIRKLTITYELRTYYYLPNIRIIPYIGNGDKKIKELQSICGIKLSIQNLGVLMTYYTTQLYEYTNFPRTDESTRILLGY